MARPEDAGQVAGELEVQAVLRGVAAEAHVLARGGTGNVAPGRPGEVTGARSVAVLAAHVGAPLHLVDPADSPRLLEADHVAGDAVEPVLLARLLQRRIG